MSSLVQTISESANQTECIAATFARQLQAGSVVLLVGEMGAGKTTFVRGACRELGVTEPIASPTFTIAQRYQAENLEISHLDLYRLEHREDTILEPLDEELAPQRIVFVEWPQFGMELFPQQIDFVVRLEHVNQEQRRITISDGNGYSHF